MASITASCARGPVSSTLGTQASLGKRAAGFRPATVQLWTGVPCFVKHYVCGRRQPSNITCLAASLDNPTPTRDAPNCLLRGAEGWVERITETDFSKAVAPIVASAGFYWQASASALEDVVQVEDPPTDLTVILVTSGIYAILYFLVIPAIIYNYLRLRWYKRKAAETFFQFLLVFVFFPGMLLLAPFINFRRLPRKGTEPP